MSSENITPLAVSCALIVQNQQVLAVKRSVGMDLAGYWEFPGGKVETGENPEQCLIREIKEELDLIVELISDLTPSVFDYPGKRIQLIPFLVRIKSGEILLKEHEGAVWLGENELFEVNWAPADIPIVRELKLRWSEFFTN
ncbi:(deoxy)nucleoside triphosphate pyrophosphohydrolase [Algoriphagus hitonicola]|uniref:8-oxo-dGTP diphosphatase n=1 Tax=Algoriphagus hitonicola TaxID=435880 RepID=A0A1I2NGT5_9BACT|nr:(deoxy)nucleoside triphosphate pyrophosphohydrolase [Algoriphagus hitonicola]SFG02808.1 8-oxo-dGTP diphosphatase [Algoriphagus hitonicola]